MDCVDFQFWGASEPIFSGEDPRDYQVALEKDRASYAQAGAQLVQAESAQIPLAEAQLAQAQAQADSSKANSDYLQRTPDTEQPAVLSR